MLFYFILLLSILKENISKDLPSNALSVEICVEYL